MNTTWPRIATGLLGLWLFSSPYFWTHSTLQATNARWLGVLLAILSAAAAAFPRVRYAVMGLAVWLWISLFALPIWSEATIWNGILVAVLSFGLALWPLGPEFE